ncbi:hypothetical protein GLYMA_05G002400v4 [Glycine max]|uniref:Uncharacterized protein n=2 Tax=Glycine subgen. Soja TaxID=1462606 RepID=I1K1M5_SOYBN|nr:uncharacterized protein LOC100794459 [Glycine max]KAG5027748.1 hypothetical protein JHK87_011262 [Glycine soja]KAH1132120.1 hypothetical protein GYH30_011135 [Glycine max]KAH1248365.1 hypothetical protein GmHk_05G011986 [Glycine max]KRH56526.1 hypothetical protein GLYMA_05G002400v4 [Glycine max]|eukprot:XP_003524565.1 uncharacterized protein LOC100794459 [Glycine max]
MEDDPWELCNDDGFVFKRKRRRIHSPSPPSVPDQEPADTLLRERKKQTLLKLKSKYEKEILLWETLLNTLRSMQQRTTQQHPQPNLSLSLPSTSSSSDSAGSSLLHDLLLQVEAQEAIIRDVSNLCDIAETVCVKREEQLKQTLFDLPIWASPLELMQGLYDGVDD